MSDALVKNIGKKIRKIRRLSALTLSDMSEKTGISVPMISKIETGQTNPSISTYANIASALRISLGSLVSNDSQDVDISIVKSTERPVISRGAYIGSPLAFRKFKKDMEPFIFEYPIETNVSEIFQHENEEMIFVLKGSIEFKYGGENIILNKGDCAYFNGNIPHYGRALDGRKATAIVVQSNKSNQYETMSM